MPANNPMRYAMPMPTNPAAYQSIPLSGQTTQSQAAQAQNPQYGLQGAENAMLTGAMMGLDQIGQTQGNVNQLFGQGIEGLTPFAQTGTQSNDLQAALSGALGPEAQQQAMANYQSSPYVDQARQNAERAIMRNASATGSVGSGNTLDQLYQNAAGMFMQDFGNQFGRMGQVADRGYNAASGIAGLQGQQAGIQAGLGQFAANIPMSTGMNIGAMRNQAGRDIAQATQQTTSALANLINQQGAGMADIAGNYANNINSLYQAAAQGDAQAKEQLSVLLANMATQSGSQVAGLPIIPGAQTNLLGQVGQLASGIGGLLQYYPQGGAT